MSLATIPKKPQHSYEFYISCLDFHEGLDRSCYLFIMLRHEVHNSIQNDILHVGLQNSSKYLDNTNCNKISSTILH